MRVKSSGLAPGLAKFENAPPPGQDGQMPRSSPGGAQLELTDALQCLILLFKGSRDVCARSKDADGFCFTGEKCLRMLCKNGT